MRPNLEEYKSGEGICHFLLTGQKSGQNWRNNEDARATLLSATAIMKTIDVMLSMTNNSEEGS